MNDETFGPWSSKLVPNLWEESKTVNVSIWYDLIARSMGVPRSFDQKSNKISKIPKKDLEKNQKQQSLLEAKGVESPRCVNVDCPILSIEPKQSLFTSVKCEQWTERENSVSFDQFLSTPQFLLHPWTDNKQTLEESIASFSDRFKAPKKTRKINSYKRSRA